MSIVHGACGHNVWVGNAEMCDARMNWFNDVIHVHHEDSPTPGRCKAFVERLPGNGLFIKYVDGTPLGEIVRDVARFARQDQSRLLCHCAAGICRGPTMAIIAKVARGCTPWQAMADVAAATWTGYGKAPMLFSEPMTEIFRWYWEGAR